jgi:hypothetical protein
MFFIKHAEVYDDSDGTTLSSITPSYTSDLSNFEGFAVNAKLNFKNVYSGALSEYIIGSSSQKFLTIFDRPVIFKDRYFDVSFLYDPASSETLIIIKKESFINSVEQLETLSVITPSDEGVYRYNVDDANCAYDRIDLTLYEGIGVSFPAPSTWTDAAGSWTSKTATVFNLVDNVFPPGPITSYVAMAISAGTSIRFTFSVSLSGTINGPIRFFIYLSDNVFTPVSSVVTEDVSVGSTSFTVNLTAASTSTRLVLEVGAASGATSGTTTLNVTIPSFYYTYSAAITETKSFDIDCGCLKAKATGYYLSWMNYLGGFDYWYFTAYADNIMDITESEETEENLFPEWPNSYGEFADTIRKQTFRNSREQILVRSQHVSEAQLQAIKYIKTSPLVQIVNSIYDRRTVIVDADSFTYLKEGSNLYEISFTITYTDDVPSQRV